MGDSASAAKPKPGPAPREEMPDQVIIRPVPKAVVLYPTFVVCLIFGVIAWFMQEPATTEGIRTVSTPDWMGLAFVCVFGTNLFIMNFEFGRATSLAIFALGMAVFFAGLFFGERFQIPVFASIAAWLTSLRIHADAGFYWAMAFVLFVTFAFVFLKTRFDYWVITSNEVLHKHGLVGNVERFPAPNLRITKEIQDVFEWLLLRSGRLVLHPQTERRSLVLELVFNVNKKERVIKELLSKLQVDLDHDLLHSPD